MRIVTEQLVMIRCTRLFLLNKLTIVQSIKVCCPVNQEAVILAVTI